MTDNEDILTTLSSSTNELDWPSSSLPNSSTNENYAPRIVQVTNFQATESDDDDNDDNDNFDEKYSLHKVKKEMNSDDEQTNDDDYNFQCEESLFTKTIKRRPPWEDDDNDVDDDATPQTETENDNECQEIEILSQYEEQAMLKRLRNVVRNSSSDVVPSWIRRFYRKLCLRELKRSLGRPIFDIDNMHNKRIEQSEQIIDRFICSSSSTINGRNINDATISFHATLVGQVQYELFESPHTGRILHPFIYRNEKCIPPWIKVND